MQETESACSFMFQSFRSCCVCASTSYMQMCRSGACGHVCTDRLAHVTHQDKIWPHFVFHEKHVEEGSQSISVSWRCFTSHLRGFFSSNKLEGSCRLLNSVWECPYRLLVPLVGQWPNQPSCGQVERLSLTRGGGLRHYFSPPYNVIPSFHPRQLNNHSHPGSPSLSNPYQSGYNTHTHGQVNACTFSHVSPCFLHLLLPPHRQGFASAV